MLEVDLIYGLQNGCCVSRREHRISFIVHLHQSSWVTCALSMSSNILKGIFFSEQQVSMMGLSYSVNHVVNRLCYHLGFAIPFIEHRQSQFRIIMKRTGIFRMVDEHWLHVQTISCISALLESQPAL